MPNFGETILIMCAVVEITKNPNSGPFTMLAFILYEECANERPISIRSKHGFVRCE